MSNFSCSQCIARFCEDADDAEDVDADEGGEAIVIFPAVFFQMWNVVANEDRKGRD
jgi:hypothetical protein